MPYKSLADFLEELGQAGELARVEAEVDPVLEIAAIAARASVADGPALLFTRVKGCDFPVVANLLAVPGRICRVLGVRSLSDAAARVARAVGPGEAPGLLERLGIGGQGRLDQLAPRQVRSGPCQQIVWLGDDIDLGRLPLVQAGEGEAGPAIHAAAILTAEPDSHRPLVSRSTLQPVGRDRMAVGWAPWDEPAQWLLEYRRRGQRMPVAAILGGDPAFLLAASALVSPGVDAPALAGLLRDKAIDVVEGRSIELHVPAEADIVIEGYVDPADPPVEAGPLVVPLGCYTTPRSLAVMRVTAVTHRANPIYWASAAGVTWPAAWDRPETGTGTSPQPVPQATHADRLGASPHFGTGRHEIAVIDACMARIVGPLVRAALPEIVDYAMPEYGAGRHWAVIAIHKTYAGQARRVAAAALGLRQFAAAKVVVVVDDSSPLAADGHCERAISLHVAPARDIFTLAGPADPYDPASAPGGLGQKVIIDATSKLPEELGGPVPRAAVVSRETIERIESLGLPSGLGSR